LTVAQPKAIGDGPFRERLKGYGVPVGNPTDVLWNFEKFLIIARGMSLRASPPMLMRMTRA
jgi:glutathione peroxidase